VLRSQVEETVSWTSPAAYAVYGYDQMAFLLAAIDAAQSTQHAAVIAALHRITYDAILGPIHVDSHGKMLHAPMYLYVVSGQHFRLIGPA
jgi:ABC-type branched-subunit amino acid transport system substrate-binding protein